MWFVMCRMLVTRPETGDLDHGLGYDSVASPIAANGVLWALLHGVSRRLT